MDGVHIEPGTTRQLTSWLSEGLMGEVAGSPGGNAGLELVPKVGTTCNYANIRQRPIFPTIQLHIDSENA